MIFEQGIGTINIKQIVPAQNLFDTYKTKHVD